MKPMRIFWALMGGVVLLYVALWVIVEEPKSTDPAPVSAATPTTASPRPAAVQPADRPVSEHCVDSAKMLESKGVVRPGDVNRQGATLLVDRRWADLPFELQEELAVCLSHYIAGSQDKWIKKIRFTNQASGVTYGTIEGTRYRTGK